MPVKGRKTENKLFVPNTPILGKSLTKPTLT
nr:MAG TPA: hypothetical protein [Caudoviricetes sp.]